MIFTIIQYVLALLFVANGVMGYFIQRNINSIAGPLAMQTRLVMALLWVPLLVFGWAWPVKLFAPPPKMKELEEETR